MHLIDKKSIYFIALLVVTFLNTSNEQLPTHTVPIDTSETGNITYLDHNWSLRAKVVGIEQVSALGSRGHAALLIYADDKQDDTNYVWVLLDLQGYNYDPGPVELKTGQEVLVYVSGAYVDERGIDYERCSDEAGDYCTVLSLVEGAYPKSIDMHSLPISPGNELIHHGSSSRNWWNGMLAWKIALP